MITITLDKESVRILKTIEHSAPVDESGAKAKIEVTEQQWQKLFVQLADAGLVQSQTVYNPHELNIVLRKGGV